MVDIILLDNQLKIVKLCGTQRPFARRSPDANLYDFTIYDDRLCSAFRPLATTRHVNWFVLIRANKDQ